MVGEQAEANGAVGLPRDEVHELGSACIQRGQRGPGGGTGRSFFGVRKSVASRARPNE